MHEYSNHRGTCEVLLQKIEKKKVDFHCKWEWKKAWGPEKVQKKHCRKQLIIKQNFAYHGMSIVGMINRHDLFKFMLTSVRIDTHVDSKSSYPCQTPPLRIIKEEVLHIKKGLDKT